MKGHRPKAHCPLRYKTTIEETFQHLIIFTICNGLRFIPTFQRLRSWGFTFVMASQRLLPVLGSSCICSFGFPRVATAIPNFSTELFAASPWNMTSQISSGRTETSGSITRSKAIGLFTWKTRWGLSWRGWVLIAAIGLLGAVLTVANIYSFLAVTKRVDTDSLVVEGWIDEFAIQAAPERVPGRRISASLYNGWPRQGKRRLYQ